MTAVAKIEPEPQSLLEVIARAARDPNVDIDKMERLLQMQERVHARNAREAYAEALAELQPLLPVISERGKILNNNNEVQSTYAYWEDVNEHIRTLLSEHGFSLSFRTGRDGDLVTVTGVLAHRMGHSEETTLALPADISGKKNAVQSIASSLSYGKRYTAFMLLNVTTKGEDDDGQGSTNMKADGEPVARAKLEGKHPSASKLKAALHDFTTKLAIALDGQAIDALEAEYAEDLEQGQRYLTKWLEGDGTPEKQGINRMIVQKREELGVRSTTLEAMLNAMRQQTTAKQLAAWAEMVLETAELSDAEHRIFETEYDAFEAGLSQAANLHAG